MLARAIYTIGYQGLSLTDLIERLELCSIARVVDVRELPNSRKPGFSKRSLAEALRAKGIEYVHLRACGNPYRNQKDSQSGLGLFTQHLRDHPEVLEALESSVGESRAALLCFETEAEQCHRGILAEALAARNRGLSIRHL
jgi:uncharacterized protein (DUF488 family)